MSEKLTKLYSSLVEGMPLSSAFRFHCHKQRAVKVGHAHNGNTHRSPSRCTHSRLLDLRKPATPQQRNPRLTSGRATPCAFRAHPGNGHREKQKKNEPERHTSPASRHRRAGPGAG